MCFVGKEVPASMRAVESLHHFEGNRYGVNGPNVFRNLHTLTSPAFFGLDEMHLIGHGISHQLYNALNGEFNMSNKTENNKLYWQVQTRHLSKLHWHLEIAEGNNQQTEGSQLARLPSVCYTNSCGP
ncbi:hypothetical protein PHYBLDRAFT_72815 [Phycomyces blakesleeanus NRRL 1555(-)]|uniref:Uncharacterized protein n=1 Tax=Phycomyces blakesleeanus (strain ATCC 8743b / DSM 1359 / FGSC 10004 / NBRC 33097 / NRRL 1555) TaxID=763407 RepID=A0A162N737_PHYB8|nr:hypothetical protein PHYBLDRAFT_72815 [Phycomyces blakesleeanus NRRL 1555(-)]OAD71758.1 hypothetical protein PHYBLDRAFT_72815 [Phycomyces blakesleeanus NRRL 1555(-)]|eukprot:XP_018289798.1 hypothetical protein PHYBLDRAFT_72815 [Phycomyces blakesleeanus NRRL 1555(-)]